MARKRKSKKKVDRLSALHDDVLNRIISRIPTTRTAQMIAVSKRLRSVWSNVPVLSFSDSCCSTSRPKVFCKNVWKCLSSRKSDIVNGAKGSLVSFKLEMKKSWNWSSVDRWLRLVRRGSFTELDISMAYRRGRWYRLPLDLLRMKSLMDLRLFGVEIKGIESLALENLKSLLLENVKLSDHALQDLLSGSTSLEKLSIHTCRGLCHPKVSGSNLKNLEIGLSASGEEFRIGAPDLESFLCRQLSATMLRSLSLSKNVRHLSFIDSQIDNAPFLEDLISSLTLLDSLTLRNCRELDCVTICSPKLRRFTFDGITGSCRAGVKLDSPNLAHFFYRGYLDSCFSLNPENLLEAHVTLLARKRYCDEWFICLAKFLASLNCSKSLILDVESIEVLKFPPNLRKKFDTPLPKLKQMKIRTESNPTDDSELQDALNWVSPNVETLSITKK